MDIEIINKIIEMFSDGKTSIKTIATKLKLKDKLVKKILIKNGLIVNTGQSIGLEEFIRRAREIHGDRYDYSKVIYPQNNHKKVIIICKNCGKEFEQAVCSHLRGYGCDCQRTYFSKGEVQVKEWLDNHKIRYELQKRFTDCRDKQPLPFDFYLPDYNTCIEFQGQQHYNESHLYLAIMSKKEAKEALSRQQYHDELKRRYCKNKNIYLIEIIYDEIVSIRLNKEFEIFKDRYNKVNVDIPEQDINKLGRYITQFSVETTGTRQCEICGKEFKPHTLANGMLSEITTCCGACAKERRRRRSLEKYGYESANASPEVKAKQQATCIAKYGTPNAGSAPEFIKKARQTCIERYGVTNGAQTLEARAKISAAVTKYIFTPEMEQLLRKLYLEDNLPTEEIAKILNIGHSTIIRHINNLDLHRSGSKLISLSKIKYDVSKEEFEELYIKQKLSYAEISKITGMPEGTISRWLKKYGLINPSRSAKTNNVKYTTETWIKKAQEVHGDKYDYSLVDYKTSKDKVKIICKKCGRIFEQNPNHHLRGCGCKYCKCK